MPDYGWGLPGNFPSILWYNSITLARASIILAMIDQLDSEARTEYIWRTYLTTGRPPKEAHPHWAERKILRPLARRLPKDPRCQACYYPFEGVGGFLVRNIAGIKPTKMNPHLCNICERFAREHQGGAEIELSMLFADVRGSTTIAENMSPSEYSKLINRFYKAGTKALYDSGALVEKLIGDEVAGLFVPGLAGQDHARKAVDAAKEILLATGHADENGPWIAVGAGVHTGIAYVGSISSEGITDITALGDSVNITARLASQAGPGEVIVSDDSRKSAGLPEAGLEARQLQLKGRAEPVSTWVVEVKTR
jgi:adenylate cyclase